MTSEYTNTHFNTMEMEKGFEIYISKVNIVIA